MDRFWFLTWTTYGTWLPGDDRGFVSNVTEGTERANGAIALEWNQLRSYGGLALMAKKNLQGPPVLLVVDQADALLDQFHETAGYRGWGLQAVAIMRNHVHVVLGVPGDPYPKILLRDLKSYGSRKLNSLYGRPESGTWWTESGSRRKLADEAAVAAAVAYVRDQEFPLALWSRASLGDRARASSYARHVTAAASGGPCFRRRGKLTSARDLQVRVGPLGFACRSLQFAAICGGNEATTVAAAWAHF